MCNFTLIRFILFLSCGILYFFSCMHRNGHFFTWTAGRKSPFWVHAKKMSVRRFDRDNVAPIVGFHIDQFGCPYFQVFATILPFGPLDGDTWCCKTWRKNHGANANHAIVPPYAGVIDNSSIFRVYPRKGISFLRFRQKKWPFCSILVRPCKPNGKVVDR